MDEKLFHTIHRAKRGDLEAFADLVNLFKGQVYRFAVGMVCDRMDAEDLAQEAFVKAFYSLSNLENEYAFSSWLIRIVSNLCKDRLKKRGKENWIREEAHGAIEDKGLTDLSEKLSIEEAMTRLSVDHREVVLLHDVQGYHYEEIAEMVGVPLGTVKSRLFAARLALRKELIKGGL